MKAPILLCVAVALLAACSPRASLTPVPVPPEVASTRTEVFLTTNRAALVEDPAEGSARGTLGFARFDVSIPPSHEPGRLALPRGQAPDPTQHILVSSADLDLTEGTMRSALRQAFAEEAGAGVLYVHGFNNVAADSVFRIAQLSHDLALGGVKISFGWPSAGSPLGYAYDRDSALYSRDALADTIALLEQAGGERLVIVAHSMGALLTMEALRTLALEGRTQAVRGLDGVVLIAPDIDVDVFRAQAAAIGPLPQPFLIFTSQRDRALRLSARLSGASNRLGSVEDLEPLDNLPVTVLDVSAFNDGSIDGHFVPATSPQLLAILSSLRDVDAAFQREAPARTGLLPGTVLNVQNATQIILSPVAALGGGSVR